MPSSAARALTPVEQQLAGTFASAYNPGSVPGYTGNGASGASAPQVGSPPPDWQQIAAQSAATRGVQYADAQATFDRGNLQRDFGYDASGGIDPSNPYSRAMQLQQNYQHHTLGNANSFAGQGQLYAGSLQNAQNATTRGYLTDSNTLRNQYAQATGQTYLNQLGASVNAGSAVSQEQIQALLRALGQG